MTPHSLRAITDPRARITALADFLTTLPPGKFDMASPGNYSDNANGECSSPACVGGWTRAIWGPNEPIDKACEYALSMPAPEAFALCFPSSRYFDQGGKGFPHRATPHQAALTLRYYLHSGRIDWRVGLGEIAP